jgi:hypothetical protein
VSQRIRMLINNLWDTATLNVPVGTEISTLPITHTQVNENSKTAVIAPNVTHTSAVTFTMPNFVLASGLVIYRHWLSNAARWRLELYDGDDQTGNLVYDSGLIDCVETKRFDEIQWFIDPMIASPFDAWPFRFSNLWFEQVFFKSGRLSIVDPTARNGVHEFDRIYLGSVIEPSVNFRYGHSHQWFSGEQKERTVSGSNRGNKRQSKRKFNFDLAYTNERERPLFSEAVRKMGINTDWFISMFPESGGQKEIEYAMSCTFVTQPPVTGDFYNNYLIPISVEEA